MSEDTQTQEVAETQAAPEVQAEATPESKPEAQAAAPTSDLTPADAPLAEPKIEVDEEVLASLEADDEPISEVTIKMLLEAGVHFGHQTKRWNPKMARYIFGKRNDIHIVDLQKTLKGLKRAAKFLNGIAKRGGRVLFVSTKRQAQEIIQNAARRANQYWVTERWLGGMLTNFETIKARVKHLKHLQKMQDDGIIDALGKKEASRRRKELARLEKYLGGIQEMRGLPEALFIVDPRREAIAVKEARKLKIPVVALVDTNCDPDEIDFVVPGNDDAIRSIKLVSNFLATNLAQLEKDRLVKASKSEDEGASAEAAESAEAASAQVAQAAAEVQEAAQPSA